MHRVQRRELLKSQPGVHTVSASKGCVGSCPQRAFHSYSWALATFGSLHHTKA